MIVVVQIFHKIEFSKISLPHPLLVVWNDLYKDHIGFIYYFNLLILVTMATSNKLRERNKAY